MAKRVERVKRLFIIEGGERAIEAVRKFAEHSNWNLDIHEPDGKEARALARRMRYPLPKDGDYVECCSQCGCIDIEREGPFEVRTGDRTDGDCAEWMHCPTCDDTDTGVCYVRWPNGECDDCEEPHKLHVAGEEETEGAA